MGLATTIASWALTAKQPIEILAWDDTDYIAKTFPGVDPKMLTNLDTAEAGQCFIRFLEPVDSSITTYIHYESINLNPINDWDVFKKVAISFKHYISVNDVDDLTCPEFRILLLMKFRGKLPNGRVLLSDVKNITMTVDCPIEIDCGNNECIGFEYELSAKYIRNYFFNASKREFVFRGKPSWIE